MTEYSNSRIIYIIEEYVHDKTIRDMLIDRYTDGLTYSELAEKYGYSVRQTQRIIYKYQDMIFKHLEP